MIIEWPLNGQFHGAVTDVLTSRTGVSEMVDQDDDHKLTTFFGILPLNVDISDSKRGVLGLLAAFQPDQCWA